MGNMLMMGEDGHDERLRGAACEGFEEILQAGEAADDPAVVRRIAAEHSARAARTAEGAGSCTSSG